jgi:hypothetical protein
MKPSFTSKGSAMIGLPLADDSFFGFHINEDEWPLMKSAYFGYDRSSQRD